MTSQSFYVSVTVGQIRLLLQMYANISNILQRNIKKNLFVLIFSTKVVAPHRYEMHSYFEKPFQKGVVCQK